MMKKRTLSRGKSSLPSVAERHRFIGRIDGAGPLVNFAGNYDYLNLGYYVSQDLLLDGHPIVPTCQEMLDAYVPPLFLEKARLAGVPVPKYYISNGYFEPPVIVDPINPFIMKGRVVFQPGRAKSIAKSLTRNFTYAICCQELPPGSSVAFFNSVIDWSIQADYREQARAVWEVFKIPVARVRVIRLPGGERLLSDISPLPFSVLRIRELKYIEERVQWHD